MTLAILLGIGGIAAGIGTGTAAMVQSNQIVHLQAAMAMDLEALEKSVKNAVTMQTTPECSGNQWPNLGKGLPKKRNILSHNKDGLIIYSG